MYYALGEFVKPLYIFRSITSPQSHGSKFSTNNQIILQFFSILSDKLQLVTCKLWFTRFLFPCFNCFHCFLGELKTKILCYKFRKNYKLILVQYPISIP